MPDRRAPYLLGGEKISAGERKTVDLPLSVLSNHTPMSLPVHVIHGRREGPTIFVSAAVHGDEIIGVEIVRRLMQSPALRRVSGTVLLIPIVNAFGFIGHSRYLPDRRDLNRSFPGSAKGSLASQLAHRFLTDVVSHCDFGIDLHSAAIHRVNLPQIRVSTDDVKAKQMADVFGAPVIIESPIREGSLRHAAGKAGVPMLLYEAGEGLRFDEYAVRVGVKGVLRVLKHMHIIAGSMVDDRTVTPPVTSKSSWLRAPEGGILRSKRTIGDSVTIGEVIGVVSDPFGEQETEVVTTTAGLIVGRITLPVVNQGDALFHIARMPRAKSEGALDALEDDVGGDPMFDEDEII